MLVYSCEVVEILYFADQVETALADKILYFDNRDEHSSSVIDASIIDKFKHFQLR